MLGLNTKDKAPYEQKRKEDMNVHLIKSGVISETYLNIGKTCASNQLERMLSTAGSWRLTTCPDIDSLLAGLLGGPGRSQRKGQVMGIRKRQ